MYLSTNIMAVEYYPIYNTNLVCDGDLERDSCFLTDVQVSTHEHALIVVEA